VIIDVIKNENVEKIIEFIKSKGYKIIILTNEGNDLIISFKNRINTRTKNKVLEKFASLIEREKKLIIRENNKDINFAIKNKVKENLLNRLLLNLESLQVISIITREVRYG